MVSLKDVQMATLKADPRAGQMDIWKEISMAV